MDTGLFWHRTGMCVPAPEIKKIFLDQSEEEQSRSDNVVTSHELKTELLCKILEKFVYRDCENCKLGYRAISSHNTSRAM